MVYFAVGVCLCLCVCVGYAASSLQRTGFSGCDVCGLSSRGTQA